MHIEVNMAAARCRNWLVEQALPYWATVGFDRYSSLFVEGLNERGAPLGGGVRFRVQSRQIYVFSHATLLGWYNGRELALQCGHEGMPRFSNDTGQSIFALTQDGQIANSTVCCYEYAFALLADIWLYRLTEDEYWQQQAEQRYLAIERLFDDPINGGFHATFPPSALRSQNPHMHLFEALLVAAETFPEPQWQIRATSLYQLFRNRFIEPSLLREFFNLALEPHHPDSHLIDPGHHYEWCWLLARYRRLSPSWAYTPAPEEIDECLRILLHFAQAHGHGPAGLVMDEVTDLGEPYRATSRLWCQTEHLKALLASYEEHPNDTLARQIGEVVERLFCYFIEPALPGQWFDQLSPDGQPLVLNAPASTFYHLFVAFSELVRVSERK